MGVALAKGVILAHRYMIWGLYQDKVEAVVIWSNNCHFNVIIRI
jgi:hypothetical protein